MDSDIYVESTESGVATIIFNRPKKRNAFNYDGWISLRRIAEELDTDSDVKVVILTGYGMEAYSAGADIKDFELYRNDSRTARKYAAAFDGAMDAVEALSKPTISMIRGFCVGGGCELSMATDIRISADNGKFGIPVARLGILIGYKEMRRLIALVGVGNASYILLSGRMLDASEALRIGLVNQIVSLERVREYTYKLAHEMVPLAPLSQRHHKQILQTVLQNPSLDGLTVYERERPYAIFDSEDFKEGRTAFSQRRTPHFKGY